MTNELKSQILDVLKEWGDGFSKNLSETYVKTSDIEKVSTRQEKSDDNSVVLAKLEEMQKTVSSLASTVETIQNEKSATVETAKETEIETKTENDDVLQKIVASLEIITKEVKESTKKSDLALSSVNDFIKGFEDSEEQAIVHAEVTQNDEEMSDIQKQISHLTDAVSKLSSTPNGNFKNNSQPKVENEVSFENIFTN